MAKSRTVKNVRLVDEYVATSKTIIINALGDLLKITYDTEALTLSVELTNDKEYKAEATFEEVE